MEQDILQYAAKMQCPELHMFMDEPTGLRAVIAIHSTKLGPALGGCRCVEYPSTAAAAIDAIRLAQGMTYKAAISDLPLGGGKMVILKPKTIRDRVAFFKAVGRFVDTLHGRYITAVDSGTSVEDMDIVASITPHVTSTSKSIFSEPDPSPMTADGVYYGIRASVLHKLGKKSLEGIRVSIQGLGHAGYRLAEHLYEAKAKLTVYDIVPELMDRAVLELDAKTVNSLDELLATPADVFAPCALGGVVNDETMLKIQAPIIAGCANNQLEESYHGVQLMKRGILYAPDFVINAGGLIYVAAQYSHITEQAAKEKIEGIYEVLMEIFQRSEKEGKGTNEIADAIALENLQKGKIKENSL